MVTKDNQKINNNKSKEITNEKLNTTTNSSFYGLGIAPRILERISALKFTSPTPIQTKAIPPAIDGLDIVGVAQTGTGKTLAYIIPIYQRIIQIQGKSLVLVPTRELAIQIDVEFRKVGSVFGAKTAVLIGGAQMFPQISALRKNPQIIIATPGRLMDHIKRRNLSLDDVCIVVLDEADRMLDMGFMPQINSILQNIKNDHQTMLFSATLPNEIMNIANKYMKTPINIEVAHSGTIAEGITQELFIVSRENKNKLLLKIINQYKGSVLLFTRTKYNARNISKTLRDNGYSSSEIHSDRSLGQRVEALDGFKSGKYRILVATDIASRGIDVKGVEIVINYDVPEDPESYVHRIGRTGRAGCKGRAITFATKEQKRDINNIERLTKAILPLSTCPEIPSESFKAEGFSERRSLGPRKSYRKREEFTIESSGDKERFGGRSSDRYEKRGRTNGRSGNKGRIYSKKQHSRKY